mgnify:CR=1 FL=1
MLIEPSQISVTRWTLDSLTLRVNTRTDRPDRQLATAGLRRPTVGDESSKATGAVEHEDVDLDDDRESRYLSPSALRDA